MDVIFALEIGGFTSYNAESCKININHSSTYKTTYMKVEKFTLSIQWNYILNLTELHTYLAHSKIFFFYQVQTHLNNLHLSNVLLEIHHYINKHDHK